LEGKQRERKEGGWEVETNAGGGTMASREQETMMVKLTPRQTNLKPRLTSSLLTDHITLIDFQRGLFL